MHMVLIGGLWTTAAVWTETITELGARGHSATAVALPGQGDGRVDVALDDQIDAVLAAIDASETAPLVVGHSAASTLAWIAADRRADAIAGVAFVGGMPAADGSTYAAFFELTDGVMTFPGWDAFAGPDSDDLTEEHRASLALETNPVPGAVATGIVKLRNAARYDVPVTMVCPEYSAEDAQGWVATGGIPEIAAATSVRYVDIDTGHWPMTSAPQVLADALVESIPPRLG